MHGRMVAQSVIERLTNGFLCIDAKVAGDRTLDPAIAILDPSCAGSTQGSTLGSTRASIEKKPLFVIAMDCRIKPGNDVGGESASTAAGIRPCRACRKGSARAPGPGGRNA